MLHKTYRMHGKQLFLQIHSNLAQQAYDLDNTFISPTLRLVALQFLQYFLLGRLTQPQSGQIQSTLLLIKSALG